MYRKQGSQKLRQWQVFLRSFDQTIVYTAGKKNFITDPIYRNYIRIGTLTEAEHFIPESIDNANLHRTPTLSTPTNTITCNHSTSPPLTPDMLECQSSTSDCSHTDCECNLCRSRGKAVGHHYTCPSQDDDDWEQVVSYPENTEFQEITPPTGPQEADSAALTPINPTIFKRYTPLTVVQIEVEAFKEDIDRMFEQYKYHKRDHWTNCYHEYCKTHYSSHLNRNRCMISNFATCSVCGTCGHGRITCDIEGLILEKEI